MTDNGKKLVFAPPPNAEFPVRQNPDGTLSVIYHHGLTKREYFAGLAMQGVMTKNLVKLDIENGWEGAEVVAEMAVAAADALLAELAKTEKL